MSDVTLKIKLKAWLGTHSAYKPSKAAVWSLLHAYPYYFVCLWASCEQTVVRLA